MSDHAELNNALIKLNKNNYDLTDLTSAEIEKLQQYFPAIVKAVGLMGELGLKSQEKVSSTIDKAIDIFAEQLKDPNLSEEERNKINDRIVLMVEKACEKDSEFKRWMSTLVWLGIGGSALVLAGKNPEVRAAALKLLPKDRLI